VQEREVCQVSFARGLYKRFRHLIHELAKFGVVGMIGVVITDVGYNLLYYSVHLGPLTSVTIATIAATCFAFVGNRYWTFRHREGSGAGRETVVFFGLNGVALLMQYATIGFTNYALSLTDKLSNNIALLLGIGFGTLFRFWSYRKWVWVAPSGVVPTVVAWTGPRHAAGARRVPVPVRPVPVRPDPVPAAAEGAGRRAMRRDDPVKNRY
jgi:putative flippase GtrA